MEHSWRGHYFFRLRPKLLPLPRQWCEPDHLAASGVYGYESYRYLLDIIQADKVSFKFQFAFNAYELLRKHYSNDCSACLSGGPVPFFEVRDLGVGSPGLESEAKESVGSILLPQTLCLLPPRAGSSSVHSGIQHPQATAC